MAAYASIGRLLASERTIMQQAQARLGYVEQRLTELRAEVINLEFEAEALNARTLTATRVCYDLLLRFLRGFFNAAPDDVLLLIFKEVIAAHDRWDIGFMEYERQRAQAPFVLAAVCRRWRRLAVATPVLWTYFGLPEHVIPAHVDSIAVLTKRSQRSPIDVVVDWRSQSPHCIKILNAIGPLADRFRRVEWATNDKSHNVFLAGLQGPTPQLTHLCAYAPRTYPEGTYLPYAPHLQSLRWRGGCSKWTFAAANYKSLTVLTIWDDPPLSSLLNILCAIRNVLEELNLGADWVDDASFSQDTPFELPRLVRLHLWDWDWAKCLRTPALKQLATCAASSSANSHRPNTLRLPTTVTDLILNGQFKNEDLGAFEMLASTTTLTVGESWYRTTRNVRLSDSFLSNVMARDPPLWPRLKHLRFESVGHGQPVDSADLIAFLRSRNGVSADSHDDTKVSRIESVRLDYDAPAWLVREVKRLTVDSS